MSCDYQAILDLAGLGQWDEAHTSVQQFSDPLSCQIHGYLHRVEGDLSNAAYWYHRVDMSVPANSLEDELQRLMKLASIEQN